MLSKLSEKGGDYMLKYENSLISSLIEDSIKEMLL